MDADGPDWAARRAAEAFDCPVWIVENSRRHCMLGSFELALHGHQRGPKVSSHLLDGEQEAQLIALRWGPPPKSYGQEKMRSHRLQLSEIRKSVQSRVTKTWFEGVSVSFN